MAPDDKLILERLEDRVLTITLNRPQSRNAISSEMSIQMHEVVQRASEDNEVGAIVLTATGTMFCPGGDMKAIAGPATAQPTNSAGPDSLMLGGIATLLLHQMPKPTISMIRGAAAGGGLAWALACDLRYADDTAKFTYAYTKIGLSGDFGANYILYQRLGPSKAREFCLLCPLVDARQALDMGLITGLHPHDELETRVYQIAKELASGPSAALARIKANLAATSTLSPEDYLKFERDNFLSCRESDEHRESVKAFIEKRRSGSGG